MAEEAAAALDNAFDGASAWPEAPDEGKQQQQQQHEPSFTVPDSVFTFDVSEAGLPGSLPEGYAREPGEGLPNV